MAAVFGESTEAGLSAQSSIWSPTHYMGRRRTKAASAQFAPQDLAHRRFRQTIPELDQLRHLVPGQILLAVLPQDLDAEVGVLLHHEDLHRLAGLGIRHADAG